MSEHHNDLLAMEREDRQRRSQHKKRVTRGYVKEALDRLPEGHPAASKLVEALALMEDK